ncbi:MAG: PIN domain-containing protein [Solirubrobacterales bacterium]
MTPDSSVVIAAFASWNRHHEAAIEALVENGIDDLVAHAELESYSVLTRLPEPFRAEPALVAEYLHTDYPGKRMVLPERARREIVRRLASRAIAGAAAHDAIVAAAAAHHGHGLLSCDRRAASSYNRLDVEVVYL